MNYLQDTLSQVNADNTFWSKINRNLGKVSNIKNLTRYDESIQNLDEFYDESFEKISKSISILIDCKTKIKNDNMMNEIIEQENGLVNILNKKQKNVKPGSVKDRARTCIRKYIEQENMLKREMEKSKDLCDNNQLDEDQSKAIDLLRKGESLIIQSEPGMGKTHISLYSLDRFVTTKKNNQGVIVYIAPTSDLALQAFSNLSETFPGFPVGIATSLIYMVNRNCKIIVGTPLETLNYFRQFSMQWSTMIIDEIHELNNKTSDLSLSINELVGKYHVKEKPQIIGLSATIHPDDEILLVEFLSGLCDIEMMQSIRLSSKSKTEKEIRVIEDEVTPKTLFYTLQSLEKNGGTMVFCEDDISTWTCFSELINYIEVQDDKIYHRIWEIKDEVNTLIQHYFEMRSDLCRLNNLSKPPQNEIRVIENKSEIISNKVKKMLMETLRKELNGNETQYDTILTSKEETKLYSLGFQHTKKNKKYSPSVTLLLHVIALNDDICSQIPEVGPYFLLCPKNTKFFNQDFDSFDKINIIKDPKTGEERVVSQGNSETDWAFANSISKMSSYEKIPPSEIKFMIKMTLRALRYGVALIMPSLPFICTYLIKKYLNQGEPIVVFSTHGMAAGINYGLRNVVIVNTNPQKIIPSSLLIQMSGRAGRRGFGIDKSVVCYIGIEPPNDTYQVERLFFPSDPPNLLSSTSTYKNEMEILTSIWQEIDQDLYKIFNKIITERSSNICLSGANEIIQAPYLIDACLQVQKKIFLLYNSNSTSKQKEREIIRKSDLLLRNTLRGIVKFCMK